MRRALALLIPPLLLASGAASGQLPARQLLLTDGSGGSAVTASWSIFAPQPLLPAGGASLVIRPAGTGLPPAAVAAAINRLLARTALPGGLPRTFKVSLGAAREQLVAELGHRLRQPGANWDLAAGRPRSGDYDAVVRTMLAEIVARSPVAGAFARHGYQLRLDGIARVTQEPPRPRSLGLVPTHIDEMDFSASKVKS